jgi:general secretion pathway protein L
MENFLLRLAPDSTASWCPAGAPARVAHGTLTDAARAAVGGSVRVLVPTEAVTLLSARIPTRQRQRLRQALPFALEDQLAADVETLHFAAAARPGGDEVPCAVVDRATLRSWLDALEAAGIAPDSMLPDVLALPRAAGEWSVLAEHDSIRLRSGEMRGFACDGATLPHLLPLLLQQEDQRPTRLQFHDGDPSGEVLPLLQAWCDAQGIELQRTPLTGDALTLLAAGAQRGDALNLLQGEFSRREQSRQLWQPWRAAAVLVVLLTLLHGGMAGARYAALAGEDAQLTAQIEQVYRSAFPESQRVVNARIQMEQKLAELRRGDAGQEFHRLLQHAAPALRSAGIELRALHYSPGLLDIEVTAADLQALDRLKQALDSGPLRAEITGADSSSGGVAGRIALRGAAA